MFGRATITLGIGPHSTLVIVDISLPLSNRASLNVLCDKSLACKAMFLCGQPLCSITFEAMLKDSVQTGILRS